jgi:poly [ADP-ribose] polymerase
MHLYKNITNLPLHRFYVIQILHPIGNDGSCTLFTRWGRVGENGQQQKKGPFPTSVAIAEFKKQFKAKAATDWENRVGMTAKKGKYFWIGECSRLMLMCCIGAS